MSRSLLCGYMLQLKNYKFLSLKNAKRNQQTFNQWKNVIVYRSCSSNSVNNEKKYIPFSELLKMRREEAKRSIIVQVQSAQSYKELHSYCNQLGNIRHMFHYTSGVEPLHFILIEFKTEDDAEKVLINSCHIDDNQAVPVRSPYLWFKIGSNKKSSLKASKSIQLDVENGNKSPSNETVTELLKTSQNISDQMRVLYGLTKLDDLGFRLRFLTARQLELAVCGMFPDVAAYPFGSSINGFGKLGCDLDLILKFNKNNKETDSRLMFQCKAGLGNERSQSQRHMEAIGDLLHLFLPGCSQVRRILQARVPILKYNQQFTDIECDLSMTNLTALHMSELLYLFGSMDDRVRPLVFTIKKWANEIGLTNSSPGRWITNFSLTLLVLAFLQRTSVPILPSINSLIKLAGKKSTNIEDEINYLPFKTITSLQNLNTDSLESLLLEFFEYYSNFDFTSKAITLNEATVITKPEHCALYIVNPLERALNVSKNVSIEELDRLRTELRNAAWLLESHEKRTGKWGILSICNNNHLQRNFYVAAKQNRMMEVKNLFEDDLEEDKENLKIDYKNEQIKKEIEKIQIENAARIDNIKMKSLPKKTQAKRR